jgi:hemoglobin-like flavoprotein
MYVRKDQISLVQNSWLEIEPVADHAATIFYARLFAIAPETAELFAAADMRSQRDKLMISLRQIVVQLHVPEPLHVQLEELGRRHSAYGVRPEHYDLVGEALVWMLEQVLHPKFDAELSAAWVAAYTLVAARMQAGLRQ